MEVKLRDVKYGRQIYAHREAIKEIGLEEVLHIKLGQGGERYGYKELVYDSEFEDIVSSNIEVLNQMVRRFNVEYVRNKLNLNMCGICGELIGNVSEGHPRSMISYDTRSSLKYVRYDECNYRVHKECEKENYDFNHPDYTINMLIYVNYDKRINRLKEMNREELDNDRKLNNINKGIRYYTNSIKKEKVKMYNLIQEMISFSLMECHVNSTVTVVRDNSTWYNFLTNIYKEDVSTFLEIIEIISDIDMSMFKIVHSGEVCNLYREDISREYSKVLIKAEEFAAVDIGKIFSLFYLLREDKGRILD